MHFKTTIFYLVASCPGVCVANRISCFCEAILDIDHLCKSDLRCCVAKKLFDGESPPKELIIPKDDKNCQDGNSGVSTKDDDKEEEKKVEKEEIEEEEEEEEEEEAMETSESKKDIKVNADKKNPKDEIPTNVRCRGTCVTGRVEP